MSAVSPLDEVAKLMDERSKYEAFLVGLDKGGDSKPAHVVAKVKADYTKKLNDVIEQLKANHDVLTQHAESLGAELKKLEAEEKAILDEQSEAEIRKQVGELSDSDWLVSSKKAESRIIKIKESQQLAAGDINRIRGILGSSVPTPTSSPAAEAPQNVDELAFLKSVVGTSGTMPKAREKTTLPAHPRVDPPTPAPARKSDPKPVVQPPQPPPSVSQSAPIVSRQSTMKERLVEPDPMDVSSSPPPAEEPIKPVARPTPPKEALIDKPQADVKIGASKDDAPPMSANIGESVQLKSRGVPGGGGGKKTLKCKECGTLNNPAEWYCERCGAELAQI